MVEITSKDIARYFRENEKAIKWAAIERQERALAARRAEAYREVGLEAAVGGAVK